MQQEVFILLLKNPLKLGEWQSEMCAWSLMHGSWGVANSYDSNSNPKDVKRADPMLESTETYSGATGQQTAVSLTVETKLEST